MLACPPPPRDSQPGVCRESDGGQVLRRCVDDAAQPVVRDEVYAVRQDGRIDVRVYHVHAPRAQTRSLQVTRDGHLIEATNIMYDDERRGRHARKPHALLRRCADARVRGEHFEREGDVGLPRVAEKNRSGFRKARSVQQVVG